MAPRTKEEWIRQYEKITGREYQPLQHELIAWEPERGVMSFIDPAWSEPGVFELHIVIGDGKYWMRVTKSFMAENGLTRLMFFTRRNPKAIERRFGCRIQGYVMEANIDEFRL